MGKEENGISNRRFYTDFTSPLTPALHPALVMPLARASEAGFEEVVTDQRAEGIGQLPFVEHAGATLHCCAQVIIDHPVWNADKLSIEHQAEARALWNVCALLEKELVEPLKPDYGELLDAARERLADQILGDDSQWTQ